MNRIVIQVGIFILSSVLCVSAFSEPVTPHKSLAVKPTTAHVNEAIQRAATYLMKQVEANGQFEYRINLDSSIELEPKYNILRHAGSLFAMSTYYERQPTDEMKLAIKLGSDYLRNDSIASVLDNKNMLAVWSRPEVAQNSAPVQAKLGGTGLGLVALLSADKIGVKNTPLKDLQALGEFLVYMQNPDGSFVSKYIPSQGGKQLDWHSLYYPGEAALGLVMLYQKDGDEKWLMSAVKTLQFLANKRKNAKEVEADHWALLATEQLLATDAFDTTGVSRELLIQHGVQVADTILKSQITSPVKNTILYGGFTSDGRVTPSATRLEGLLAAYNFIPKTHDVSQRLAKAIPLGILFLVRAQVVEGDFSGAFPRAVTKLYGSSEDVRNFNRRATEVRIDYVQHALSALMQYRQLIESNE